MNLTGMPTRSGLSNVPRRTACSGVPVLRERSRSSSSKSAGRGQHRRGSRKMPTQTQVLVVMESTGTNQQAKYLAMLTSRTPCLLIPTFLRHHLRKANGLRPLPQRHDENACACSCRSDTALKACPSCPGTSTCDESTTSRNGWCILPW